MGEQGGATIPTSEEIAKLPRWAQVAFAARCARRAQPLFKHGWSDVPPEYADGIDRAVAFAEALALAPGSVGRGAAEAVRRGADGAATWALAHSNGDPMDAAAAAADAARAAAHAAAGSIRGAEVTDACVRAARATVDAGAPIYVIHRDFELLLAMSQERPTETDASRLSGNALAQAEEAERSLLGALLLDPRVIPDVIPLINAPEQFLKPKHWHIFQALRDAHGLHQSGDLVQLVELLRTRGQLEQSGGPDYLVELAEHVPSAASARHSARVVMETARLRERSGQRSFAFDDDAPVPPEVFGPMWPDGVPEGWPPLQDGHEPLHLKIEITVPSGMSEAESKAFNERVATFFAKLSGAHVALGGTGLRLLDHSSSAPLPELNEEPVGAGSGCGGVERGC